MQKISYKGFSLVELMIVLAIIGILGSLALPSYREYVLRAKMTEAVKGLSAVTPELLGHLQIHKKAPRSLMGIPNQGGTAVFGKETDVIEGYRFHGNGRKYWFVVRVKDGVFPEDGLRWSKREVHLGFAKTPEGHWVTFCGSWNPGWFIDLKYLPSGCQNPGVNNALEAALR